MTASINEPRFRLLVSMAPAVVLVALLLQALALVVYSQVAPTDLDMDKSRPLNVLLSYAERQRASSIEAEQSVAVEDEAQVQRSEAVLPAPDLNSDTRAPIGVAETTGEPPAPPANDELPRAEAAPLRTTVDWRVAAKSAAVEYLQTRSTADAQRMAKWRTSGSVLFKPEEEAPLDLDSQVLPSYPFRNPAGVAGLGLTVGQCFVGLPLIGIPVEDRTPTVGLIYCRN